MTRPHHQVTVLKSLTYEIWFACGLHPGSTMYSCIQRETTTLIKTICAQEIRHKFFKRLLTLRKQAQTIIRIINRKKHFQFIIDLLQQISAKYLCVKVFVRINAHLLNTIIQPQRVNSKRFTDIITWALVVVKKRLQSVAECFLTLLAGRYKVVHPSFREKGCTSRKGD